MRARVNAPGVRLMLQRQQIGAQNYDKFLRNTLLHNYELDSTTGDRTN